MLRAIHIYLMNGQNPATDFKALFKNGEKIRLRFINSSAMTFFDVRIPGLKMTQSSPKVLIEVVMLLVL